MQSVDPHLRVMQIVISLHIQPLLRRHQAREEVQLVLSLLRQGLALSFRQLLRQRRLSSQYHLSLQHRLSLQRRLLFQRLINVQLKASSR
jgi:hypothetical protein